MKTRSGLEDGGGPWMYPERRENPRKSSKGTESERVERNAGKVCAGT